MHSNNFVFGLPKNMFDNLVIDFNCTHGACGTRNTHLIGKNCYEDKTQNKSVYLCFTREKLFFHIAVCDWQINNNLSWNELIPKIIVRKISLDDQSCYCIYCNREKTFKLKCPFH